MKIVSGTASFLCLALLSTWLECNTSLWMPDCPKAVDLVKRVERSTKLIRTPEKFFSASEFAEDAVC